MRSWRIVGLAAAFAAVLAIGVISGFAWSRRSGPGGQAAAQRRILYYRSAMNPQMTSPTPKKDEMGMDYVPVYAEGDGGTAMAALSADAGPGAIWIDPRQVQNAGVTSEPAQVRTLRRDIRTVGVVKYDERRLYSVNVKFTGWVERLEIGFVGEAVRRGEPLATVYSPEVVAAEQELITAERLASSLRSGGELEIRRQAESTVDAARRRLRLLDLSDRQIDEIARREEPSRTLTLYSPVDGVVVEKDVTAGSQVVPGTVLFRIADLRDVWIFADVYPEDAAFVRQGQQAQITATGLPGKIFEGRVDFIQPVVAEQSRTMQVRIEVAQRAGALDLKPNMFVSVEIRSPVEREGVIVPEQAVLRTGERSVAVVDLGNGYFEPREVRLGPASSGEVEILQGIRPGERVVTSSQFLIDSESNLRAALSAMRPAADAGMSMGVGGAGVEPDAGMGMAMDAGGGMRM